MESKRYAPEYPKKKDLSHQRRIVQEKAVKVLEKKERPHMDDDEARQNEPGQYFGIFNFLR